MSQDEKIQKPREQRTIEKAGVGSRAPSPTTRSLSRPCVPGHLTILFLSSQGTLRNFRLVSLEGCTGGIISAPFCLTTLRQTEASFLPPSPQGPEGAGEAGDGAQGSGGGLEWPFQAPHQLSCNDDRPFLSVCALPSSIQAQWLHVCHTFGPCTTREALLPLPLRNFFKVQLR